MISFFFLLFHLIVGQPLLNLYYTDLPTENKDLFEHDCLRVISTRRLYDADFQMMFFCLSKNASAFGILKDDEETSKFTFAHLSQKRISAEQLYYWSAPMDTVEKYQDYLNTKNFSLEQEIFSNCTLGRFGRQCEYQLSFELDQGLSLYDNMYRFFDTPGKYPETMTYYQHLECHRDSLSVCLDWRDICNGQIDCLNDGIDERDCWQIELKSCKENERRCFSGQCIISSPSTTVFSQINCFKEQEDEIIRHYFSSACRRAYNFFQCDDLICSTNSLTGSCDGRRENQLSIGMHWNEDGSLSKNCSRACRCLFNSLSCEEFCEKNQCIEMVEANCPSIFFYPNVPILFANLYFAYMKKDFISSQVLPYICLNTTDYDHFFLHTETFLFNNTRCVHTTQFYSLIKQSTLSITVWKILENLYQTLKPYHLSMNYSREICNRSDMYQCLGSVKCVHIYRILDGVYDCPRRDDEIVSLISTSSVTEYIERIYFKCPSTDLYIRKEYVADGECHCSLFGVSVCEDENLAVVYTKTKSLFPFICDRSLDLPPILIEGKNHSDESECEEGECDNIYTRCDKDWNCFHGEDENDCYSNLFFRCSSDSRRCVSPQTNHLTCLSVHKINDGKIDCLGGTDEEPARDHESFPSNSITLSNFFCFNGGSYSSIYISELCNGINDCEHGDDERFFTTTQITPKSGICTSSNYHIASDVEKFLCSTERRSSTREVIYFLIHSTDNARKNTEKRSESSLPLTRLSPQSERHCHYSLPVRVQFNEKNQSSTWTCFCPPNYYGLKCQYQNERISLRLQFQTLPDSSKTLFIVIFSLIDDSDQRLLHSYQSFTYLSTRDCRKIFLLPLHYSTRPKNASREHWIRVDVYEKLTLHHRGSLLFPVEFPFLPVHYLTFFIDIPSNNTRSVECHNRECQHGRCMTYWNQPSNVTFCQCDQGWRGKSCQIAYQCQCASDALCFDVLPNGRSICLCPKNRFGSRCLISSHKCATKNNSACFNRGECLVTEDYNGLNEKFICRCKPGFSGDRCENVDKKLILSFARQIPLSQSILIHFIHKISNKLDRSTTFRTIPVREHFLTIFWSQPYHMAFVGLLNKDYYLAVLSKNAYKNGSVVNKTIERSDRCPNITELFNETVVRWHIIRRIKLYHLPCQNRSLNLSCFHDEVHLCLCYDFYGKRLSNCFVLEHNQSYDCFGRSACEHNSRCLQDAETCPKQSMYVCDDCFFGRKCQFRTDQFGLSLDAILGYHIVPINRFSFQPLIIKLSLAFTIVFMSIGFANGLLSLITFANKPVREVGCGLQLFATSITTLLVTMMFSLKFLILLLTHMTIITDRTFLQIQCYSLDFLMRICLSLEQWLTACMACERAVTVLRGTRFVKRKSKEAAKKVISVLVIVILCTFLHDPLSRDLTDENDEEENDEMNRTWCIVRYRSGVEIYNYLIQTFHFIGPFLVNLISSLILIINKSRQNAIASTNRSFRMIL